MDEFSGGSSLLDTNTGAFNEEEEVIEAYAFARNPKKSQTIRATYFSAEMEDEKDHTLLKNHTAKQK